MNPTFSRRNFVSSASFSDDVATPSSNTLPDVGKSIAPARFSSVDFPHPLRPTSATNCPASTSSDTPSSARTGCPSVEYSLLTFCMERIGIESEGRVHPETQTSNVSELPRPFSQYVYVTCPAEIRMPVLSTKSRNSHAARAYTIEFTSTPAPSRSPQSLPENPASPSVQSAPRSDRRGQPETS